jgi:predicted MPP superfamily phosphohydrolase
MEQTKQVILHLSDLHFGCDKSDSEIAARALALEGLNAAIMKLPPEWKPTIICISGDIAYKGLASEYEEATVWLTKLLNDLGIRPDHVVTCAGNHDIDRNAVTYDRPKDAAEADQMLAVPLDAKYEIPLQAYVAFAQAFGIQPLQLGTRSSYLIGQRTLEGISFCSLNSAWFCRDQYDKEQLWIGRPYVDVLEHAGQVLHTTKLAAAVPTVFLLHHPKDWFHQSESHSYGNRPNTFDVVAGRCHLLLTGHTHGESRRPDRNGGAAHVMTGGATYDSATYNNAFTLIRVRTDRFTYCIFDYDPRSATREWRQTIEATDLLFRDSIVQGAPGFAARAVPQLNDYREATQRYAKGVIEAKCRALRPRGALPVTVPAFVTIQEDRPTLQQDRPDKTQHHRPLRPITLIEATRTGRRTLLLGDLGSGKSTLAAKFVVESQARTQESIALSVPAKLVKSTEPPGGVPWSSTKDFLASISAFVNNHVLPTAGGFDLYALLETGVEVAIAIDGLDEVSPLVARVILDYLADVVNHWSTVQVLATGRPVELAGLDYAKWQLCTPVPAQDDDKLQLFIEEAVADGKEQDSAIAVATTALARLRALPELHSLADTPLFCKLLFDQLQSQEQLETLTLGDLLYPLLGKRLAEWATRDGKASVNVEFDSLHPDSGPRVTLLSHLAASTDRNRAIPVEQARRILERLLPDVSGVSKSQLVDQAMRSFESAGLVSLEGGNFELSLRSFDDFCRGYALADAALTDPTKLVPKDLSDWRSVAFAATMARRFGVMDVVRPVLREYIKQLLVASKDIAASAYIVAESRDQATAEFFIDRLSSLGRRPLSFSYDNPAWPQTAQAIAESIRLAGKRGFDWFFGEYLDPRFPFVYAGSQLTVEMFLRWAALQIGTLTEPREKAFRSLIMPHVSGESHQASQVIPALAVLIPDAFDTQARIKRSIQLLEIPQFHDAAERLIRDEFQKGNQEDILGYFTEVLLGGDSPQNAALLYLNLSQNRPTSRLVRAILTQKRGRKPDRQALHTLQRLKDLLGVEPFARFCRWYLFNFDTLLSAGAAIELFNLGERRLALLSSALIQALHDGGYVPRAEEILATLIAEEGRRAAEALVTYITNARRDNLGGHSGWWRLLFLSIRDPRLKGPELLVDCMRGVGEFLLARYPEIRSSFRDLVLDPQSARFRSALHNALNHAEPEIRHGAAMVLVTSDPTNEAKALETVVHWKSRRHHGLWFEWEQFCLTLRFGPAVLSHLQSKLGQFSRESRIFALAILFQNGTELDDTHFQELITGSLTSAFTSEILSAVAHADRIRKALLKEVDEGTEEPARKAAEILLGRPREELDDEHHVRCMALALDSNAWRNPEFASELDRLKKDPNYARRVVTESQKLIDRGFRRPLIDQIYEAESVPTLWEDLVWNEICTGTPGFRVASHGQWILDFLVSSPTSRAAIGKAARKFLYDSRVSSGFNKDEPQSWLALLAHEGGELTQEELGEVVDRIDPIDKSAYVPLITRLGRAPKDGRRRRFQQIPQPGAENAITAENATFERFIEFARPAEVLHPEFCSLIEQSLFNEPFSTEQLQALADQSLHGTLVAGALATAYGIFPEPTWALTAIGQRAPSGFQDQHCMLTLLNLWRIALFAAKSDSDWRNRYLTVLKKGISGNGTNLSAVASELLEIDQSLSAEHLGIVLKHVVQTTFDDQNLYPRLAYWLSTPEAQEALAGASSTVDAVLAELDLQPWNVDEASPKDAGAYLMFPLLRWRLAKATDIVSRRVFLRGLKMAVLPPRSSDRQLSGLPNRFVGIDDVAPLIATVDRALLEETIQYGLTLDDQELRAICGLFVFDIPDGQSRG